MPLPPVESTPILLMRFTAKAAKTASLLSFVEKRLKEEDMIVLSKEEVDDCVVFGITTTRAALEREAELIRWLARTNDTKVVEYFTVVDRDNFITSEEEEQGDRDGLFSTNDWSLLAGRILDDITVLRRDQTASNLSQALDEHRGKIHGSLSSSSPSPNGTRGACLRYTLKQLGLVDVVAPVHFTRLRNEFVRETVYNWHRPDIHRIHNYFGDEIAFFFGWLDFYQKWLLVPGTLGLFIWLLRWYREDTIDEDEYTPLYGLFIFVWGILFITFWDRQENRFAYLWGTYSLSDHERTKFFATRPGFRGILRQSPVTGEMETFYPASRRRFKYIISGGITFVLFAVAFFVMLISLNLQGFISPKHDPDRWNKNNPHPFHFPMIAALSEEGNILDTAEAPWKAYIPVLAHVAFMAIMNTSYGIVSEHLTKWENHETKLSFRNSIVVKQFLFQAFDCYVALFYLAFYERDVDRLRQELVSVFNVDTFRRILMGCVLPTIMGKISNIWNGGHKKVGAQSHDTEYTPLSDQAELDVHEQFDDYMEMVIQFGYITLFASAYPLASVIAMAANYVELRTDAFKMGRLTQRPRSYRSNGLGTWKVLLTCIIWMSALTNCLLFGFTSNQMRFFLPSLFVEDDDFGNFKKGRGWIAVFIMFGLERVLLTIGLVLRFIIPQVPEDMQMELERCHHIRNKERKELHESFRGHRTKERQATSNHLS